MTAHTTISSHQFGELGQSSHSVAQDDIVRCFTAKRMAEEYLRYYERLVGLDPNHWAARLLRQLSFRSDRSALRCRRLDASPFPRATILTGHYFKRSWQ